MSVEFLVLTAICAFALAKFCIWVSPFVFKPEIYRCVLSGDTAKVVACINAGANVNVRVRAIGSDRFDRWTPLMWAAFLGKPEIARSLIEAGADSELTEWNGKTALHLAVEEGHESTVQVLLSMGAAVNAPSNGQITPLHRAVLRKHVQLIAILIQAGADCNALDQDGKSPIEWAKIYAQDSPTVLSALRKCD